MLEVLHVKGFGIYPVVNAKCWKDYEESGDRIKLVFISEKAMAKSNFYKYKKKTLYNIKYSFI